MDEIGLACSRYGGKDKCVEVLVESLKKTNNFEDLEADGGKVLKCKLKKKRWEVVDWIDLALDRGQWWTLVNTVMNLWVL